MTSSSRLNSDVETPSPHHRTFRHRPLAIADSPKDWRRWTFSIVGNIRNGGESGTVRVTRIAHLVTSCGEVLTPRVYMTPNDDIAVNFMR
jgi:hypothetical protein